ncbi:MAG TPA: GGDEF domain-containing protein [Bosea sp. (in: a-proteobacteria)]|uniref:GGDEF domain-containing protein n=1 Tax=Bosea sp. (in: a-proteobacteria) TaxID=1871050 RepID=UPI002E1208FD|nr:GGDEF domain-containing protein [Bosea sp. (in: a-proteobacteria)]
MSKPSRRAANPAAPSRVKRCVAASALKSVRERLLERSLRQAERQLQSLRSLAYHDELCGIYNRRAFNDELQRVTDMAQRYGGEAAIVMIDVDNLKTINDRHGHAVGDIALVAVAQVLKSSIRSSDVLARIGGDEFAIILHHIDEASAQTKITDMRERVAATQINTTAGKLALAISVGHSMISVGLAEEAMRYADHAMYRNKRAGRTIYQHT